MRLDQYEDHFNERPIQTGISTLIKIGLGLIAVALVLGTVSCVVGLVTAPAKQGARVIHKIIDADNMLTQYRWFHDASASLDLYPVKIKKAAALAAFAEAKAPDRLMARQTELTGLEQTCLGLVGDYNSRATRLDAGFFRNPEHWLPVATEAWAPLPASYPQTWCDEGVK